VNENIKVRIKFFIERNPHYDAVDFVARIALFTEYSCIEVAEFLQKEHGMELTEHLARLRKFYDK